MAKWVVTGGLLTIVVMFVTAPFWVPWGHGYVSYLQSDKPAICIAKESVQYFGYWTPYVCVKYGPEPTYCVWNNSGTTTCGDMPKHVPETFDCRPYRNGMMCFDPGDYQ